MWVLLKLFIFGIILFPQSIYLFCFISKIYFLKMGAPILTMYFDIYFFSFFWIGWKESVDAVSPPSLVTIVFILIHVVNSRATYLFSVS